jgi:hypothetical protein
MRQELAMKLDEFEAEEEAQERCPQRLLWRRANRRRRVGFRRSRAHEMARRGMHQRRNERLAW